MDETRFDAIVKAFGGLASRRSALQAAGAAGLAATLAAFAWGDAAAKKRKKRKKRKKPQWPCPSGYSFCTTPAGCYPSGCCLLIGEPEGGLTEGRHPNNVCCSAATGGGQCPSSGFAFAPFCCPPSQEEPEGGCALNAAGCNDPGPGRRLGNNPPS